MHEVLSATYGHEVIPDKLRVWNAGREISRLFFGGNRWVLPFFPAQNPSPISRLSRDILSEIFMWSLCADGFRPVVHPPGNLSLEPLTLSHVSNHWRDVAISTPSLWSTIWIDRPREAHIPMVELWLERSRQCPLVLYLRQSTGPTQGHQSYEHPREYELTNEILLLLGEHLHRWKRVTFLFYKGTQRALLNLQEVAKAAPLLEHVQLSVRTWDAGDSLTMERILYSYASVKSVVVHPSMTQGFVCWDRLTILDAKQIACSIDSYLDVLRHCTSLHRAEIRCSQDRVNITFVPPSRRARLRLPHLSSLTVVADRVDLRPLLDGLFLPQLEGLVLRYNIAPRRSGDPQALWRLLTCSTCVLKRFSLRDHAANPADYPISFLQSPQMASLLELYMQVDLTDKFMKFLTLGNVEDDTPRMLPNLQTISLHDLNGDHIDDLELYRMVVSRLAGPGPRRGSGILNHAFFSLRLKGHSASAVLPWLVERCRERLNLRIFIDRCEDPNVKVGWYTSPPIPGGYLTES
ncbi:hypothetical protein B0H11DRAFT_1801328 [Mycena galericulata]|nr:hypothetical protein B0H11DRAFT_1801328 [Mycena galericulata]